MNVKRFLTALSLTLCFGLALAPRESQAQIPPKAQAFLMVSGYGAAGGALLGFASMAFGTSSRSIAQGASLGLYAGILFGTYVLVSHHQRRNSGSYDRSTPYDAADDYDDYGEDAGRDSPGGFFDSSYGGFTLEGALATSANYRMMETKKGTQLPPLTINLLNYSF
jgi:hypothetical protein